jgi:SAM-dependent methyltransferase
MNKPYAKLAAFYDQMGADSHSIKMVEYCFSLFRRFRIRPTEGLDLCCGTGTALALFDDRGIAMSGLDGSSPMLVVAANKLQGRDILLYRKELPRFRIPLTPRSKQLRTFDLVTSFYDSLNYMTTQRDLKATFRSVYMHLKPDGWFIFDMNTEEGLKILWGGQVYAGTRDDFAWIWTNNYQPRSSSATCQTTFFVKKGKSYQRLDEHHRERAYDNAIILRLLRECGFVVKGLYRCYGFEKPRPGTYRICVIAHKPA